MSMQYRWVYNRKATKAQAVEDLAMALVDLAKKASTDKVIPKSFSFLDAVDDAESQAAAAYPKYCKRDGDMEMNDWPENAAQRWAVPALVLAAQALFAEGYAL
jgi:hypothetical protein